MHAQRKDAYIGSIVNLTEYGERSTFTIVKRNTRPSILKNGLLANCIAGWVTSAFLPCMCDSTI
jgi:hypothetical protein